MSARSKNPTAKGVPPGPATDEVATEILGPEFADKAARASKGTGIPDDIATTVDGPKGRAQPQPQAPVIKAISMKTPGHAAKREPQAPVLPAVKLRAMSEMSRAQTPTNLGNLAPPYDPHEARKRSVQDYVIWGCVAVILASAIALVVWFVAR